MNRKQRDSNRATAEALRRKVVPPTKCRNCEEPGPHFVPPSLGQEGFFICERKEPA